MVEKRNNSTFTIFNTCSWIGDGTATAFLLVDASGAGANTSGMEKAFVGHRMQLPDDRRSRGLFAEWHWDGRCLTAQVDPLGFFSLFVYAKDKTICISPSILQILAQGVDATPDRVALAVFHRLGLFVGDDTPFAHIRVLPPGGRLSWTDGKLTVEGSPGPPRVREITRAQAVEAFIEVPRSVIRRFLADWDGPVELPLSGGRDSRHVLLEMAHQGRLPTTCLTFHHGGRYLNAEVQAARAIAARVGARHTILGRPRKRLRDTVRCLLLTQLCADEHAQMMPMHDYFAGSPAAAVDGIGGDILTNPDNSAAEFMARSLEGDFAGIARRLIEGHGSVLNRANHEGGAGALFSPELGDAAIDRIAQALQIFDAMPDPYQAFWFWNRTRREISFVSTAILGGASMVFAPYLDPDFVELGLSLPWSVTSDQKLHDDAIARAYPAFADVPFAEGFAERQPPNMRLERFGNVLDALHIAARVGPGGPLKSMNAALAKTPLKRGPADFYRLHSQLVSTMNADNARRLIELDSQLRESAPRGQEVVSRVNLPV